MVRITTQVKMQTLDLLVEKVAQLCEIVERLVDAKHQGHPDQSVHGRPRGGSKPAVSTENKPHTQIALDVLTKDAKPVDLLNGIKTLKPSLAKMVSTYEVGEYSKMKTKIRLTEDGKSGYGVNPDGELISVFSSVKGRGRGLVMDAIKNGANHLDCFDGHLPKLYGSVGFKETGRMKWDDQYAPDGWDYKKFGRPDVILMSTDSNAKLWRPSCQK